MSAFTTARRIEFRDTDAAGIVHFSAFFLWMESAEHELLRRVGIPIFDHQSNGTIASWPRVSVSCDYKSPIHFGGEIAITILVEEIGRTSITYGFRFEQAGIWVAQGRVVVVRCLLHPEANPAAVPIPADIVTRIRPFCAAF